MIKIVTPYEPFSRQCFSVAVYKKLPSKVHEIQQVELTHPRITTFLLLSSVRRLNSSYKDHSSKITENKIARE